MDNDYNKFLRVSLDNKNVRQERYKEMSRNKLFKAARKKIETTMIGALSTIEDHFGFLWGFNDDENMERTPEQKHMSVLFDEARAKILDRGNTQIRNLEAEFVKYDITQKKTFITLPVVHDTGEKDG